MKKLMAVVVLQFVIPMSASAQSAAQHYPWQGYGVLGVGTGGVSRESAPTPPFFQASPSASEQVAFGGEAISKPGLGLGFEMGWTHWEQHQPWLRTPSLDLSFHFPKVVHQKIEPFVQAGATLLYFQTDNGRGAAAANVGGGVNLWFARHMALRCDVKGFTQGATGAYRNILEFRVGMAFR